MKPVRILSLALVAVFAAGQAHADAMSDALLEITKCADISDSVARLKCFDAAVPHARSALAAPPGKAKDEADSVQVFGFPRPDKPVVKAEDFGKPPVPVEEAKEITEITSTVLEFAKNPLGKAVFVLDNGQVWRQLAADNTNVLEPQVGTVMKVTIEKGFLSSYNLTIDGRNGLIKVNRLK